MSLISRLFRKPPPTVVVTSPTPAESRPQEPVGPDPAVIAAQETSALEAAIAARDFEAIAALVIEGSSTGVRQQAAQAIEDLKQLRELIRRVRGGKDKSVYRILTAKRDALLAQHAESERKRAEIEAACEAIERHSHRHFDALFAPTLEQLERRWQPLAGEATPLLGEQVAQALARAREVIREHQERIEADAARERAAAEAASAARQQREMEREAAATAAAERVRLLEEERRVQLEKQEAEALAVRTVVGILRKAQAALTDGNTARAARMRAELEEPLGAAPAALPAWFPRQLEQLDGKLTELKDWKTFTVVPKRDELLREMESLVDSTLEPELLARNVRELQQQWRTLGKGAGEAVPEELQQRFRDAGNRAYEPCRLHFAAQAAERAANLERREALLARLAAFAARHTEGPPDWRLVMQVLAEARREWRRYAPVDRAAAKASQAQFDAHIDALQASLAAEFARNVEGKRALIERAAKLLELPDTRRAIDDMKELQRLWRSVGIVPRDQDEPLWEVFRQHCDAVFQRREQESVAYVAGLEANRVKATALCEDIERIGTLSGPDLIAGARQLDELRGGFEALELPQQGARELYRRFDRACEDCLAALAAQQTRDAQRIWSDLFDVTNHVRAFALGVAHNVAQADREALRQRAEAAVAAIIQWPRGARGIIDRQLARAAAGTVEADVPANEATLRALCVRAEILTSLPSPPEDEALRRAQQMQRLVQGMGQGIRPDAEQLDALTMEWIAVGPTEEAAYAPLVARFERCRQSR